MWYRIILDYGCFGIKTIDDKVIQSAPMGRWMIGCDIEYVTRWILRRGGVIEKLKTETNINS